MLDGLLALLSYIELIMVERRGMGVLTMNVPLTFVDSGLAGDGGAVGSPIDDGGWWAQWGGLVVIIGR